MAELSLQLRDLKAQNKPDPLRETDRLRPESNRGPLLGRKTLGETGKALGRPSRFRDVNLPTDHGAPPEHEHGRGGVPLPPLAPAQHAERYALQPARRPVQAGVPRGGAVARGELRAGDARHRADPAAGEPQRHPGVERQAAGDGQALEVARLAGRVVRDAALARRHVEAREPRQAAQHEEGEREPVEARAQAERERGCGGRDAEGDLGPGSLARRRGKAEGPVRRR